MSHHEEVNEAMQAKFGCTKTPLRVGPDASAFLGFLAFASGDSPEAKIIQDVFNRGHADPKSSRAENMAKFIDWLIVNHWGEELTHCSTLQ